MLSHAPICFRNPTEAGVREEQRFEYTFSLGGVLGDVRSCESIKAIFSRFVDGSVRIAESRDSPAGPPPMQTRSYISGLGVVVVVLYRTRRNAGGRRRILDSSCGEDLSSIWDAIVTPPLRRWSRCRLSHVNGSWKRR